MLGEEMIHDLYAKHVEDVAIHNILSQELFQCFAMLRASEMELIWALYFEGLTEREYAKQIGISQKGVNKRRQKVLKKLRAKMNIK